MKRNTKPANQMTMTFVVRGDREHLTQLRKQLRHLAVETDRPLQELYTEALMALVTAPATQQEVNQ